MQRAVLIASLSLSYNDLDNIDSANNQSKELLFQNKPDYLKPIYLYQQWVLRCVYKNKFKLLNMLGDATKFFDYFYDQLIVNYGTSKQNMPSDTWFSIVYDLIEFAFLKNDYNKVRELGQMCVDRKNETEEISKIDWQRVEELLEFVIQVEKHEAKEKFNIKAEIEKMNSELVEKLSNLSLIDIQQQLKKDSILLNIQPCSYYQLAPAFDEIKEINKDTAIVFYFYWLLSPGVLTNELGNL
ncbi:hypothetical protein K502DRAFT_325333 [Neoconidiobolus thromboides FSU 785]|nr:hypothetical protein K502DRAFT_325333 [Neoconidiobolus thromboides FSU 785]